MKKFRKMIAIIVATAISLSYVANAQVAINIDDTDPNVSAMLDVKSTDKGMLIPRMTQAQMEGITSPAAGLSVYNTDLDAVCYFNGTRWDCMDAQSLFDKTFFCGDVLRDFRDGKSYNTVKIGTQCWMAENLNIGTMINGSGNQTDNATIEKYCYSDNTSNCDVYGGLYQWDEMMQYVTTGGTQGICPTGWHLPIDDEWKTLEMYLGMSQAQADATGWRGTDEGGKLKEAGTSHWVSPNTGATNSSGFTGLPGGYRGTNGTFTGLTGEAFFWSSSESGSDAWYRALTSSFASVRRDGMVRVYGFSVRCVRD
jgi:uncharacterized protein (TIGR02145 family)